MNTQDQTSDNQKDTPAIYVGTYAKYNNGSIAGKWLSLDEYDTEEKFYDAARKLHKNEHDPELMFQDFENFPRAFYGESGCDERLWEWLALNKHDREIVAAWLDQIGGSDSMEYILDRFVGTADTWEDFVFNSVHNMGLINELPDHLQSYFDFDAYGQAHRHDYTVADTNGGVWVFHNG
tara:strand:- start:27 stop:563 length:537 start_codon:yes stop_codon:yes gene_type:complete